MVVFYALEKGGAEGNREAGRLVKKSRYIPKRLVQKVKRMNGEKVAVREILEVLGVEK